MSDNEPDQPAIDAKPTWEEVVAEQRRAHIDHPAHYTGHPAGIECIQVTEHARFNVGNAIKYVWRVEWGSKGHDIEDLEKAVWYLQREIAMRQMEEHTT